MKNTIAKIVNLYVLLLMIVFPLIMTDKYYNIQEDKIYFMMYVTIGCAALVIICAVIGFLRGNKEQNDERGERSLSGALKSIRFKLVHRLSLPDKFALFFFAAVLISTLSSNWLYEAFWGNMGRFQGCFMWIIYMAGYFMISKVYEPKRLHMDLFILAGLIVCAWGVLDFFYMSPIGWQESATNYTAFDFSSTIGNVNLLTAFEGIILAMASALFIGEAGRTWQGNDETVQCAGKYSSVGPDKKGRKDSSDRKTDASNVNNPLKTVDPKLKGIIRSTLYYATAFTAFAGLICGFSDNAIISIMAVICFMPFYAFRSKNSFLRYLALCAGYMFSMVLIGTVIASGVTTVSREHWGLLLELCSDHRDMTMLLFIAAAAAFVIFAAVSAVVGKNSGKHSEKAGCYPRLFRIIWAGLGLIAAAVLIYILYDANTGGHPERYAAFSNMLIFDGNWGTRRGYNWSLALRYFRDFPFFKLLFGSGPETYAIFTFSNNYYEMLNAFEEVYDSPHNEWLQYLFTTGILGFTGYYGWTVSSMVSGFKAKAGACSVIGIACGYGILTYTLVSFVNISTVCLGPVVILCLGIMAALGRNGYK